MCVLCVCCVWVCVCVCVYVCIVSLCVWMGVRVHADLVAATRGQLVSDPAEWCHAYWCVAP